MNEELQAIYRNVMLAVVAEDVFGPIGGETVEARLANLEMVFQTNTQVLDPARYVDERADKAIAAETLKSLKVFYEAAIVKIQEQTYGQQVIDPGALVITTDKRQYYLDGQIPVEGDIATVYSGNSVGGEDFPGAGQIVAKIVNDSADDDLMLNERRVLQSFLSNPAPQNKHLPFLMDYFKTEDERLVNVLRALDGYNLDEVYRDYPNGVPEKHMVWIFKRILSALGYIHNLGVIHCNLEPAHLLVRPKDHNVWIIDWSYASVNQSPFKVFNEDFSAPEVQERKSPLPSSDLYSAAKCMVYILGGDIKTNMIPETVHPDLQAFLRSLLLASPLQRPQDAWEAYNFLDYLIVQLWGEKKFLDLIMSQPPLVSTPVPIQLNG